MDSERQKLSKKHERDLGDISCYFLCFRTCLRSYSSPPRTNSLIRLNRVYFLRRVLKFLLGRVSTALAVYDQIQTRHLKNLSNTSLSNRVQRPYRGRGELWKNIAEFRRNKSGFEHAVATEAFRPSQTHVLNWS